MFDGYTKNKKHTGVIIVDVGHSELYFKMSRTRIFFIETTIEFGINTYLK